MFVSSKIKKRSYSRNRYLYFWSLDGVEYANEQQLENAYAGPAPTLYWNVVEDVIQIKITAETTGWVGFGISPEGTMVNSDVVIGWVCVIFLI